MRTLSQNTRKRYKSVDLFPIIYCNEVVTSVLQKAFSESRFPIKQNVIQMEKQIKNNQRNAKLTYVYSKQQKKKYYSQKLIIQEAKEKKLTINKSKKLIIQNNNTFNQLHTEKHKGAQSVLTKLINQYQIITQDPIEQYQLEKQKQMIVQFFNKTIHPSIKQFPRSRTTPNILQIKSVVSNKIFIKKQSKKIPVTIINKHRRSSKQKKSLQTKYTSVNQNNVPSQYISIKQKQNLTRKLSFEQQCIKKDVLIKEKKSPLKIKSKIKVCNKKIFQEMLFQNDLQMNGFVFKSQLKNNQNLLQQDQVQIKDIFSTNEHSDCIKST